MRLLLPEPGSQIIWDSDHADSLVAFWPCWDGSNISGKAWAEELINASHAVSITENILYYGPGEEWPTINSSNVGSSMSFPINNQLNLPKFSFSARVCLPVLQSNYKGIFSLRTAGFNGFCCPSPTSTAATYTPALIITNSSNTETNFYKFTNTINVPFLDFKHIFWTWDGTTARGWLNGIEQVLLPLGESGYGNGNFLFKSFTGILGSIYDFRLYNRPRPELATQLFDSSTRWNIFKPNRVRKSIKSLSIILPTPTYTQSYSTQIFTEAIYSASLKSYLTQLISEVAHTPANSSILNQLLCEVAYQNPSPPTIPAGSQTSGTYQSIILAETGLQSYWKLDETSGTSLADSKGTNTGTSHSGCTLNQPSITSLNKSILFDGTLNAYISTANVVTIQNTSVTIELWFNITALPSQTQNSALLAGFTQTSGPNRDFCLYIDYRGYLSFYGAFTAGVIPGGFIFLPLNQPLLGVWRHVAVVFTAAVSLKIYVDGILVFSFNTNQNINTTFSQSNFKIGGDPNNAGSLFGWFNGYIDEVALYNTPLSQATILSHITSSVLGTSPYSINTHQLVETIYNASGSSYTTYLVNEVAYLKTSTTSLTTQLISEVIYNYTSLETRIAQLLCEVAYNNPSLPTIPVGSQTTGSYQSTIAAETSLIGYWKLDETSGTSAADSKGSNTGTYTNCTVNQSSITSLNKCVLFNGTSSYISTASTYSLTEFTIELWMNISAITAFNIFSNNFIVGFINANNNGVYALSLDPRGYLQIFTQATGGTATFVPLSQPLLGIWRHVAFVVSLTLSSTKLYIDGELVMTIKHAIGVTTTSIPFYIGGCVPVAPGSYLPFKGYIDEVALYNIALSQSQIQAHLTPAILGTSPYSIASHQIVETVYSPQSGIAIIIKKMPPHIFQLILGQGIG